MTIVLNENEWAESMIRAKTLGKKPSETLRRVARYYIDKQYSKNGVRKKLDEFLLQCDSTVSLPRWSDTIDFALSRALKYPAIKIEHIRITDKEMERIGSLESIQARRLAFTLLCLAKYWDVINPSGDHWVNSKISDIMHMANINTSLKRQGALYLALRDAGMIQYSRKVDNTNVRVCFIDNGNTALQVSDFRNLGYQYMRFCGNDDYIQCQNCGVVVRRNTIIPTECARYNRKQRYCKECAIDIHIQKRVGSVMQRSHNFTSSDTNYAISDESSTPIQ